MDETTGAAAEMTGAAPGRATGADTGLRNPAAIFGRRYAGSVRRTTKSIIKIRTV